jgi:hypothetical protein
MNPKPASGLWQIQRQGRDEAGESSEEKQGWPDCEYCSKNKAEIFQVTGDYCLSCWQEETHPRI